MNCTIMNENNACFYGRTMPGEVNIKKTLVLYLNV
jgi:hypothetical protein